jgi:uncharacterized protein YjbI with pentapeptide repeats
LFDFANFSGGKANFESANFSVDEAKFNSANFSGRGANFKFAKFSGGEANFKFAKFSGGEANFESANFSGDEANFEFANFSGGEANFKSANFSGANASFKFAEFLGGFALFEETEFLGNYTSFTGAKFSGFSSNFKGARFSSPTAYFEKTYFGEVVYFDDAQFNGNASFYGATFNDDAFFEGASFNGELKLTRTKYNKLFIRWNNITKMAYESTAYLSLLNNFKELGYLDDYDRCYFEYRKEQRGEMEGTFRKISDYFLQLANGYGTKPLRAPFFSLVIIVIYGIFWWAIGLKNPNEKQIPPQEPRSPIRRALIPVRRALISHQRKMPKSLCNWIGLFIPSIFYSANVFLSGAKLFINPPDTQNEIDAPQYIITILFITESILGAILSILFFMALSWTVVRPL